ncbi:hypothetical protein LSTR_LSTR010639 [Laodelphax striatellus]|uniref:Disease resistance R13L4/SHOC-2-like LRR domain-containing protein n=1 Tax=Laodelphax striatellus TaxID=195883 RepID=A0A482XQW3_LAOST|nr:hypothetical protein LSTR_LSTR010639 [Laodelphax striatellus]
MAPYGDVSKKVNENHRGKYCENNNIFKAKFFLSHLSRLNTKALACLNVSNLPDLPFLNIETLDLSNQGFSYLPKNFKLLQNLKFLNLSGNEFQRLPSCFSQGFESLEHLDLSKNLLKEFSICKKSSFPSLQHLDLRSNRLNCIPEWLLSWNCSPLRVLDLSNNPCLKNIIGTCFYEKFHLVSLMKRSVSKTVRKLSLANCDVTTSKSLVLIAFESVEELDLSNDCSSAENLYNFLPNLPCASMERMRSLTVLNVANVRLSNLNDTISKFTNLRVLDASSNDLTWIPESFCGLTSLEVCDLSNNRILELPRNIAKMQRLRVLNIAVNRLNYFPEGLYELENLEDLDLFMNELFEPPTGLAGSNWAGLDFECNFFNTRSMEMENYTELRNAYREKYNLIREKGKRHIENRYSYPQSSSGSPPSSISSSYGLESDVNNVQLNIANYQSLENWEDESSSCEDDDFDPRVHALAVRPGTLVWRHRLWFGDVWKPLQCRMFGNTSPLNHHDYVIRADIPETRSNCFMANDWITDDFAEYLPFVIHPHCIIYEDAVNKWMRIPPVEGQFDDAEE